MRMLFESDIIHSLLARHLQELGLPAAPKVFNGFIHLVSHVILTY